MNLAAILPQGLPLSDACYLVQTTFLGLCCFRATRFFGGIFVPEELKKRPFLQENPYFSCSSLILASPGKLRFSCHIDASDGSGKPHQKGSGNPISKKLVRSFIFSRDIVRWQVFYGQLASSRLLRY